MSPKIHLVAVEDSADALGADVARSLKQLDASIALTGVGGARMKSLGVQSDVDVGGLAILGLFDGLRALGRVQKAVVELADDVQKHRPDSVVLIDSWGLMWRLARELKQRGFPGRIIKLVGPQVWATRPGRAKILANWCDHLLCLHDFEQPFYAGTGLPTTVIGNPAIGRQSLGDRQHYRARQEIPETTPVVGLLLGSRTSELKRVGPALIDAARLVCAQHPTAHVLCLPAPSVRDQVEEAASRWDFNHIIAQPDDDPADVMAAMDLALSCSGTVTTELAEQGVPVITGYKLGWLSWALARLFLLRTKYISLINVAANREVIPEFVQTRLTPGNLATAAHHLLTDANARNTQRAQQFDAIAKLRGAGDESTATRAATAILSDLRQAS